MARDKLKLAVGLTEATVVKAWRVKSQYDDGKPEIDLTLVVDGNELKYYGNVGLAGDLLTARVISSIRQDEGEYPLVNGGPHAVVIEKSDDIIRDGRKVVISARNGSDSDPGRGAATTDAHPAGCMCSTCVADRDRDRKANAAHQESPGTLSTPATTHAPRKETPTVRTMWGEIDYGYGVALAIAAYRQMELHQKPLEQLDVVAVQRGAATILVRAEKLGVPMMSHDNAKAMIKRAQDLDAALNAGPASTAIASGRVDEPRAPIERPAGGTDEDEGDGLPF